MDLDVFIYKPSDKLGPFLESFDTLNEVLKEVARTPGEINEFVTDLVSGMDEVIVLRHREFGSDPSFTVSSSLDSYFRANTKAHEAVFALPGRDVEGTIGGLPEVDAGGAAMGRGQFLTGAPGAEAEGVTIKYGETTDDVIYEIFNRNDNRFTGLLKRDQDNEFLAGEEIEGLSLIHI